MDITYFGQSSFRLRGKSATVVIDPFDPGAVGLKFPKHTEADIVTVSHDHKDHNAVSEVEGSPFVVNGPGEYEIKGVGVVGMSVFHDDQKGAVRGKNTIYRIEIDGLSIVHLGDLGHTLSSEQVDELDGVNILLVPVGGFYTIDAARAVQIIRDIEPSIVIPMHYKTEGLNPKLGDVLAPLSVFMKEIGKEGIVPQPKLSITKDKLPAEMQVVVLE
ncbi:MAG TPA: MBL fold metallo-hydrolase [Patescibacteria group bacterium]|nr:MBL fold metallo-hydrolase [Patescibacteria group bacterium]